jgi:hypothetical protein
VYEGLLELHPKLERAGGSWQLSYGGGAGSDRKTTGSYYTPDQLVQLLIASALLPVIADRLSKATTREEKEAALLAIRVLDPACGSGHFLLAAARRLALELARIRAENEEPSEELRQQCLRDVVAHCIYGVDKNPMAVELCKVALWIEAIEPGKPLSFLDAHIQCGDSLVGVFDPKVLEQGIPDEAYKPLTGDNKTVCTSLKKENATYRKASKGRSGGLQGSLNLSGAQPSSQSQNRLHEIEAMPEDSLAESTAKQEAYASWLQEAGSDNEQLAADLYTAAFFLPKTADTRACVPTTEHLVKLQLGKPLEDESLIQAVIQASRDFRFFHWHLRFGEVMERGGFDCVLGNPPWETMSPDVKEWFATFDPEIRNNTPDGQREIMERLLESPQIHQEWDLHCRQLFSSATFIKTSGRYHLFAPGHLGKGDFNTYRFFVELSLALCSSNGTAAMIVPENLYNGANATALRKQITEKRGPLTLRGFENAKKFWFPDIHSAAKFCFFVSPSAPRGDNRVDAAFCIKNEKQLRELSGRVSLPSWMAQEIGGEALAIPEIRSSLELEIIEKLYRAYPRFKDGYEKLGGTRPYATELHMGNERDLFTEEDSDMPIYEGKMVDQYDYRAKAYASGRGRSAVWGDLPFGSEAKKITPQWRVSTASLDKETLKRISTYRVGFCNVSSPTNQRSLIATIIPPKSVCGHAVPTVHISRWRQEDMLLFVAIANTAAMDFLVRKKVGLNMTFSIMDTLPLPANFSPTDSEIEIVRRAASLCLVGPEMESAAQELASADPGWSQQLIIDPELRHQIKAEIDVIYAGNILGLSRTEIQFILDPASLSSEFDDYETFGALKRAEIRQFSEYRTQRLVLEAWDRLESGELI